MRDISTFGKIFLAVKPVDFRKQAHGLALVVEQALYLRATSEKALFVFTNRRKSAVKCLYWDGTGFALWWKGLEKERFKWPKDKDDTLNLQAKELKWLLEGIDISKMKKHIKLNIE